MPLLTTGEVATVLRITTPSVRRLIKDGKLEAIEVGNRKRIDAARLASFLKNNTTTQTNTKG